MKESRIEREKRIVSDMIMIYCRGNHRPPKGTLCPDCEALKKYACGQTDRCRFGENKTFCSNCKVHCYKPEMREKIRSVMRYSGPRMMLYHPVEAVKHLSESRREAAHGINRKK